MKEFFESVIKTGRFVLSEMEDRIDKAFVMGKISAEDAVTLKELAAEYAKDEMQIDVAATLADLEKRLEVLESAGVKVWVNGMSVAKGQTVLYPILKPEDTTLRYCRYDGGRASTALSPGKIDGWVVLASAGGEVTHRVERDAETGKIILVPVNEATEA
jgi:hypothetical protein